MRFAPSQPVADEALYAVAGVQTIERSGRHVTLTGVGDLAAAVISALSPGGIGVSDLEARPGSLEDAFIRLTGGTQPRGSQEAPA